jgi:RimJ/RimL family protein N-acetyltransferase
VKKARQRMAGRGVSFALVEPSDDEVLLGGGSLYDVDLDQSRAAVGYWLVPEARGRGIATHAVRLLARWAFDTPGVERLELTCAPDNDASQWVAQRCGFKREGVLRSHLPFKGKRRDTVVLSLLREELC